MGEPLQIDKTRQTKHQDTLNKVKGVILPHNSKSTHIKVYTHKKYT